MASTLGPGPTSSGGASVAAHKPAAGWERLRELLKSRTFRRGEFTLVSGHRSRMYFNMKATMMHPEGASLCARLLLERIAPLKPDYIGGLEMGAVPLLGT